VVGFGGCHNHHRSRGLFFSLVHIDLPAGIATDMLVYSTVIPVFPFQLERLGYSHVSSLVGWLLFAYVRGATWELYYSH
jgi:hypothetical protein